MRRTAESVLGCLVLVAALTGTATAQEEPATLDVWVRDYTLEQDSPYRTAEAAFEAAHPGVDVVLTGKTYDEMYNDLLLSVSGGTPPDVITMDTIWLGQMAEEGIAANLDRYYDAFDQVEDIPDNFLASSKWKDSYYGVWLNTDVRLLLWNKDLFAQAGLDPETPPATWDELISMAKQIMEAVPGVYGVGFPGQAEEATADRWYPLLWMAGGDLLSPDFSAAAFDSDAGIRALQLYADLIAEGVTPQDVVSQDGDAVESSVFSGQYAMMLSNVSTGQADIPAEAPEAAEYDKHFGAGQIPLCDGCQPASGAGGYLLGVGAQSDAPDLAFEFIDMATSQENMTAFEVAQQRVPTRKSGLADTASFANIAYFDEVGKAAEVAHFAPWVPQYPAILTRIYTAIQEVILGGDPKTALDAAAADVNAILAEG